MQPTQKNLPPLHRHITTNDKSGLSIFSSEMPPDPPVTTMPDGLQISFCYGTDQFPAKIAEDQDLKSYEEMIQNPPGIVIPNGTALRIVDFPPGYISPMHRTLSVNFNIVIEGQVEFILESGEKRILNRGDSAVQRYVNHSWRNTSDTKWARISAVPIPAEPILFHSNQDEVKEVDIHTERLGTGSHSIEAARSANSSLTR